MEEEAACRPMAAVLKAHADCDTDAASAINTKARFAKVMIDLLLVSLCDVDCRNNP